MVSLPAFWNVGALLGLLFFIYAYMSVLLFGEVEYNKGLDYQANFSNFALALLTLFRCARARRSVQCAQEGTQHGGCGGPPPSFLPARALLAPLQPSLTPLIPSVSVVAAAGWPRATTGST